MPYVSKKIMQQLQLAGNMCSNVCYNLGQIREGEIGRREALTERCAQFAREWDEAKEALRQYYICKEAKR